MRKLLFLSLFLLSFSVFAEDSTLKAIKDTSEVTFSKVYNDVKTGINAVASALKVGAEHVYEVLVKQQVVNAIVWILIGVLPLLLLLVFGKSVWKWASIQEKEHDAEGFAGFCAFLFYCFTIIPSIILMFHIDIVVTGFVNPEYGALQEIMSWIK